MAKAKTTSPSPLDPLKRFLWRFGIGPSPFRGKSQFAGYYLIDHLGQGGFGDVYKAIKIREAYEERFVALKMLHEALGEVERRRFHREIDILAGLSHPNIVEILERGEQDRVLFFTMELLEGCTLKQLIEKKKQDLPTVVTMVRQLASGLHSAHEKGLVHRDIKPSNIFVRQDGKIKIIDFGVAMDLQSTIKLTLQNSLPPGTQLYMPPEVKPSFYGAEQCVEATPAYDQFALGAVAFEMLTQRRPFIHDVKKPDSSHNFSSIIFKKLRSVGEFGVGKAEFLDPVLHQAMAPEPKDRFHSIVDFAEALEKAAES